MKMQEMDAQSVASKYRLKKAVIAAVSLALFAVAAAVAYVLCTLQIRNVTQEILFAGMQVLTILLAGRLETG